MSTSETQRYAILSSCCLLAAVFLFWFSPVSDGPVTSAVIGAIGGALLAIAAGLIWRLRRVKNLSGADAAMIDRVMRNQKGFVPVSFVSLAVADAEIRQGTSDDALQRDLKASALSTTSAAMMLADADFRITFVNGATRALLTENEDQIRQAVPNFRADRIVGQPMDLFHSGGNRARKYLSDPSNLPFETDIQVGPLWFSLKIVSAKDADVSPSGFVVEWNEVTEVRRNGAIRETLEKGQILCELTPDGRFSRANQNFLQAMGQPRLSDLTLDKALDAEATEAVPHWDAICAGDKSLGCYAFRAATGGTVWINASFSAVRDQTGMVKNVLLIGNDVTEAEKMRRETRAERERSQREIQTVVDNLREALTGLASGNLTTQLNTPFAPAYEPIQQSFNAAMDELGSLPREALGLVSKVAAEGICGMELVEVAPPYDQSEITALMGTRVIVDVLGALVSNGKLGAHKRHMDKPVTIPHGEFEGKRWSNAT